MSKLSSSFRMLLLTLALVVLPVAAQMDVLVNLYIDEQTSGYENIAPNSYDTNFRLASDKWTTYLAPLSAYEDPRNSTGRQEPHHFTGKYTDTVKKSVAYSCIQNTGKNLSEVLVVSRVLTIPTGSLHLVDGGVLAMDYFIDVPIKGLLMGGYDDNANGLGGLGGVGVVYISFMDEKGKVLQEDFDVDEDGAAEFQIVSGAMDTYEIMIPRGTRSLKITVVAANTPVFCIGKFSVFLFKFAMENAEQMQQVVNITFIIATAMIFVVPILLWAIAKRERDGKKRLKMLDLVHVQGSRVIRAVYFILSVSFLFKTYQWLTAPQSSKLGTLPIFSGISSNSLNSSTATKVLKTPVFMLCFLAIGLLFWPIAMCYAHINEGSRVAAVFGLLATANMAILRMGIQYLQHNPLETMLKDALYQSIEILAYLTVVVYFAFSIIEPGRFENVIRKTNFRNAIHVMGLLRKIDVPPVKLSDIEEAEKKPLGIGERIKQLVFGRDLRPIWVRGRKYQGESLKSKIRTRLLKAPTRLIAAMFMMFIFTYVQFVFFLDKVFSDTPQYSCQLGLATSSMAQAFSLVSKVVGMIVNVPLFGATLTGALSSFKNIGNPIILLKNMINGSAIAACVISAAILVFNMIDLAFVFHRDISMLRKGNYGFMTEHERKSVSSGFAAQFMGIQVGFSFIGTIYTLAFMRISCFMLAGLVKSAAFRNFLWRFVLQNGFILVAAAVSIVLSITQQLIVNNLFVEHYEVHAPDRKKPVKVTTGFWLSSLNKYNQIDYFFLFPNLIGGILGFLGNIVFGIIGSAVFSYRVDKANMIPMFSRRPVYLSWLLQEHHHSNPVVMVALKLIDNRKSDISDLNSVKVLSSSLNRPSKYGYQPLGSSERSSPVSFYSSINTKRARTKWFLAYTLIKNPSLIAYRKQRVQETLLAEWVSENEAVRIRAEVLKNYEGNSEKTLMDTRRMMREVEVELWKKEKRGKSNY